MTQGIAARQPATRESLRRELAGLGVPAGATLLVHSSLRSLGFVCGGPVTVVQALTDVLTPAGTLVVPAQTPDNRDPSRWTHRAVPRDWWPTIRAHLPPFDPVTHDCRAMGLVAETVRTWPGSVRSGHPQTSFAAVGSRASELMARHDLDSELGEGSPLAAVAAAGGHVLLLGVGYERCTAFHLAEYRLPMPPPRREQACVMLVGGRPRWVRYDGADLDASDFAQLGADFERDTGAVSVGAVGSAVARLLPVAAAVDYARGWFTAARSGRPGRGRTAGTASE
ncbi:aminoglycoside N(3)-acetyltransferase [Micromonospora sp. NBC_01813]|uniref:aminoglycoside N(3)-acetyltransferase n=1 Tax=Micromonospora sp. NBC_01813 TaxID=2975988 RepID=UPI002DDB65E6|nr:AAC(3) family N-acetyltransferase [Micromonospora sp. NBC_01813]WSA06878.1 AAC(3) family N-acetyltransferase [Micromonospora sp. NBC_01813]